MKDRVSTYPGRVKLTPVEGRTNTYDMTRADVPTEPGTPLNQQTLLQPSTAQYLKLPYADPTVDDALRHMVDRVVPIGTIRTSPAQSLGDAWLKCDGSAVTYGNYPQLCQLLRNSTEAVTWSTNLFPTSYNIKKASSPVYFDGRWIVAAADASTSVMILSSETLDGTWEPETTIAANTDAVTKGNGLILDLAATDNYCVCTYMRTPSSMDLPFYNREYYTDIVYCEKNNKNWVKVSAAAVSIEIENLIGIATCNGRFAIARNTGDSVQILHSATPNDASSWETVNVGNIGTTGDSHVSSFGNANGKWVIAKSTGSGATNTTYTMYVSDYESNFTFRNAGSIRGHAANYAQCISKVTYFGGVYYLLAVGTRDGAGATFSANSVELLHSSDLSAWTSEDFGNEPTADNDVCSAVAGDNMLVLASSKKIRTSTIPGNGFTEVSVADVFICGLAMKGNTVVASALTGTVYYDYTYASKLLPTISLSDDTTTFIKAKNELDVFEAGGD